MSTEIAGPRRMRGPMVRIGLTVLVCLVAASAIYVRNVMKSRATPPPALPVPNAYDDIVRASKLVKGVIPNEGKLQEAKPEELRAWIELNREPLRIARGYVGKRSQVPLIYSAELDEQFERVSAVRQMARVLQAEGELALAENRRADASRSFLEIAQLGPSIGRGGIWIDVLVGVAIESMGLDGLQRSRTGMGAEDLRDAIAILLETDKTRANLEQVTNIEAYWSERSFTYLFRLQFKILNIGAKLSAPVNKAGRQAFDRVQTMLRRQLVEMAIQLYEIDHKSQAG